MFPGLNAITVDFSEYNYPDCCPKQCTHGLLESIPQSITELGFCSIDPVTTDLLGRIAGRFSRLNTLQLSASNMAYSGINFPTPKHYADGNALGVSIVALDL